MSNDIATLAALAIKISDDDIRVDLHICMNRTFDGIQQVITVDINSWSTELKIIRFSTSRIFSDSIYTPAELIAMLEQVAAYGFRDNLEKAA